MDGSFLFICPYLVHANIGGQLMHCHTGILPAALTAFRIDSKQNLQVNPSDQMVYFLQQNVTIVAQISTLLHRPAGCHSFHPPPPPRLLSPLSTLPHPTYA